MMKDSSRSKLKPGGLTPTFGVFGNGLYEDNRIVRFNENRN
jgi:hypothetical protein